MNKDRGRLLFLAHGGMELTWLYAWATFLMISMVHQPYPLPEAIGTFILGAALTLAVQGTGLRVISVLGLQVLGRGMSSLIIITTPPAFLADDPQQSCTGTVVRMGGTAVAPAGRVSG